MLPAAVPVKTAAMPGQTLSLLPLLLVTVIAGAAAVHTKCPYINSIPNGKVTYTSSRFNAVNGWIKIDCNEGYRRVGLRMIKCLSRGQWRATAMTECKYNRCPNILGIQFGYTQGFKSNAGGLSEFKCNRGFKMVGKGSLRCNKTTLQWSIEPPKCIPDVCPFLTQFVNGEVRKFSNKEGDVIQHRCDTGYEIVSPEQNWSRCRPDLVWRPSVPTCRCKDPGSAQCQAGASKCPFIVGIPNADHSIKKGDGRTEASEIEFRCHSGYTLSSANKITCTNGKWTHIPSCFDNHCPHIENIAHGSISNRKMYGLGDVLTLKCNKNYRPKADKTLKCLESRMWSNPPLCVEYTCPDLLNFPNGVVKSYSNMIGSNIKYECENGFRLKGVSSNKCQGGGKPSWANPHPECVSKE